MLPFIPKSTVPKSLPHELVLVIRLCSTHGGGGSVYRVLVWRPEGKRSQGGPRHRWEDNIQIDLREIGINVMNWIWLAHDRVQWWAFVNTVMNLRVP
jgi:hypothetical protein